MPLLIIVSVSALEDRIIANTCRIVILVRVGNTGEVSRR